MHLLDRLLEHDRWATWRLLEMSRSLSDAQLDEELDIGHRTQRTTIDHAICVVDSLTTLALEQPLLRDPNVRLAILGDTVIR